MDVLILGASSIVSRRVLPALRGLGAVGTISVLSRRVDVTLPDDVVRIPPHESAAILTGPRRLVYVSLENGAHDRVGRAAVAAGHHVILDKPAFLRPDVRAEAVGLARAAGTLLAESLVWPVHPQVEVARAIVGDRPVRTVLSTFTFPDFPAGSFRHERARGGGALSDLGPYATSAARIILARDPDGTAADVHRRGPDGLELSFSIRETFGDAVHLGYYGFGSEYVNRLEVVGPGYAVTLEPAFTTRADQPVGVRVRERDEVRTLAVPPSDTFATYLEDALAAVSSGAVASYADDLEASGAAQDRLAARLGVTWEDRIPAS